jgi:hypothetical protein
MKKTALLLILILSPFCCLFAQDEDPGFGDDGGGDAGNAPNTPINENITLGLLTGVLIAGYYFVYKRKENV